MGVDPVSWALVAVAAIGTGASIYEGEKSAKLQKQAAQAQKQQADLQGARQRRDALRQSRIAYANAQASAENQGVGGSSSSEGGLGSIVSQVNDNLSFLDQYNFLTDQAQNALGKSISHSANANAFGQVADAAMGAAPYGPQIHRAASKIFSGG